MSLARSIVIEPARSAQDMRDAATLFGAYAAMLGVDLTFQGFAEEVANLPGKYAPPAGEIFVAREADGAPVGCVAFRQIDPDGCCEMKRLYVAPAGRGAGAGAALINAAIERARAVGYREMRLDTLSTLDAALSLYRKAGFAPIDAYYPTPIENTVFLSKNLRD